MLNIIRDPKMREDLECVNFFDSLTSLRQAGLIKAVFFHVPNQLSTKHNHIGFIKKLARMGKTAGVSDYIFLWENNCGCIEFKVKGNTLSPEQIKFRKWCEENNVKFRIAYSANEGLDILAEWGIAPKLQPVTLKDF